MRSTMCQSVYAAHMQSFDFVRRLRPLCLSPFVLCVSIETYSRSVKLHTLLCTDSGYGNRFCGDVDKSLLDHQSVCSGRMQRCGIPFALHLPFLVVLVGPSIMQSYVVRQCAFRFITAAYLLRHPPSNLPRYSPYRYPLLDPDAYR